MINSNDSRARNVSAQISEALRLSEQEPPNYSGFRRAGVLLMIYYRQHEPTIMFTKRSELVKTHRGEISFPGGTFETSDGNTMKTALREVKEEIGLNLESSAIAGKLNSVHTRGSNFLIDPYVAVLPFEPKAKPISLEISQILEFPVDGLKDPRNFGTEFDSVTQYSWPFYVIGQYKIWGATARIVKQLLQLDVEI